MRLNDDPIIANWQEETKKHKKTVLNRRNESKL